MLLLPSFQCGCNWLKACPQEVLAQPNTRKRHGSQSNHEFGILNQNQQVHSWLKHLAGAFKVKFHPQKIKCNWLAMLSAKLPWPATFCRASSATRPSSAKPPGNTCTERKSRALCANPSKLQRINPVQAGLPKANKECKDPGQSYFDFQALGQVKWCKVPTDITIQASRRGVVLPSTWKPDGSCSQKRSHHHYLQKSQTSDAPILFQVVAADSSLYLSTLKCKPPWNAFKTKAAEVSSFAACALKSFIQFAATTRKRSFLTVAVNCGAAREVTWACAKCMICMHKRTSKSTFQLSTWKRPFTSSKGMSARNTRQGIL